MKNTKELRSYIGTLNKKELRELARWIKGELRFGYQSSIWFCDGEFTVSYGLDLYEAQELAFRCHLEAGDREPTLQQIEEALQEN